MNFPQFTVEMLNTLTGAGHTACLVGGCVRDAVLGLVPHDYDIATSAVPEEIIALFGEAHCEYYGKAFGTVGVHHAGGFAEITTFRRDGVYRDGRHPQEVWFTKDLYEDLARRDFTCNAMAWSGELIDPFGGVKDLEAGVLRCVGIPQKRFSEDALRILRAMRFLSRLGLTADPLTHAAMKAQCYTLSRISPERIFSELCRMLMGPHITGVLLAYPEILAVWIPEIRPCIAFEQHSRYHDFTVWEHIARTVGNAPFERTVRLTMLLHDHAKPRCMTVDARGGHFKGHAPRGAVMADAILRRLRCENRLRERICRLIEWHRLTPDTLPLVRRTLGIMGEEEFGMYLQVLDADRVSKKRGAPEARTRIDRAEALYVRVRREGLCCKISDLPVSGQDMLALGLAGRSVGAALHMLLEDVIEERIPCERGALLARAERWKEAQGV